MKRQTSVTRRRGAIPPKSILELVRADSKTPLWANSLGSRYRVGYYNRRDGLDVVWLVDESGTYVATASQDSIAKYFRVVRRSNETRLFGVGRRRLGPLRSRRTHSGSDS